jgi:hypothetical protein
MFFEPGNLIGELGGARVLLRCCWPAEEEEEQREKRDDLEDDKRDQHSVFLRREDSISRCVLQVGVLGYGTLTLVGQG